MQMPYMDIIRVAHYNLNVPYLCPQYVSFTPSFVWSIDCLVLGTVAKVEGIISYAYSETEEFQAGNRK